MCKDPISVLVQSQINCIILSDAFVNTLGVWINFGILIIIYGVYIEHIMN